MLVVNTKQSILYALAFALTYFTSLTSTQHRTDAPTTPSEKRLPWFEGSPTRHIPTTAARFWFRRKKKDCPHFSASCEECLEHDECLWCSSIENRKKRCIKYPPGEYFPTSVCDLDYARWGGNCWLNHQLLLTAIGVLVVAVVVTLICVACYCCIQRIRRSWRREKNSAELTEAEKDEKFAEEREARHEERRAQRKAMHEAIKQKYGNN